MIEWLSFAADRAPELWFRLGEHIVLTGASTLLAVIFGVPLGILAARLAPLRHVITGAVGILQTIPSLAMLALLLALLNRIGSTPAIIALVLYALLPIVRNTLTGLLHLPESVLEAADGLGMTRRQRLWMVELPLAMPVILTGIRTAAVVCVGIATLSAFIGAGGLGQFINRGLSLSSHSLILLGAIPSALLALAVDGSIGAVQWSLRRRRRNDTGGGSAGWRSKAALALPALLLGLGVLAVAKPNLLRPKSDSASATPSAGTIRVGSKNFTEQLILGELMAQLIERKTDLAVERIFDLGGTMICHQALVRGALDLYAEYTGTGWTVILENQTGEERHRVYDLVSQAYRERFDAVWLQPFGFNNTYAITVRAEDADRHGWETISDLRARAPELRAGWTFEFSERPDGYPGLKAAYGLEFGEVRDLEGTLMYEAIAKREIDVICAFATDGRIETHDLQVLKDDRRFFPPYHAAPVVRADALSRHPGLRATLNLLAGKLTTPVMRDLNLSVDQGEKSPRQAARYFLDGMEEGKP